MLHTKRSEIGEVFACFYEKLYSHTARLDGDYRPCGNAYVTIEDVRKACASLQRKKTCSDDGLVAEMLQTDFEPLLAAIAELFMNLLNGQASPPET